MTRSELLDHILKSPALKPLPQLGETIRQKWQYSHYLHGAVAFEAGMLAHRTEADCIAIATGLEVSWAAILTLDDMVDNDRVRFHGPAAWVQVGCPKASLEMACGLLAASMLVVEPSRGAFITACRDTIDAMNGISGLPLSTGVEAAEPVFKQLGALSCFAVAWPWPRDAALWDVAGFETCAGQLVNDCNDCFGAKAKRRGHPDVRNRQVSLLSAILYDWYPGLGVAELIGKADEGSAARIAAAMHETVRQSSGPLLAVFDRWHRAAAAHADAAEGAAERAWAQQRLEHNFAEWRRKLLNLLNVIEGA